MITRLCSSLGMCARHTRALMHQPGAAHRLTAVYRYVLAAALGRLDGQERGPGGCPGCEHDDGAAGRADPGWLAGTDPDAGRRAALRSAAARVPPARGACVACQAAARSETGQLQAMPGSGDRLAPLCAGHLSDLIVLAGPDAIELLAWQVSSLTATLAPPARDTGPRTLWSWRRHPHVAPLPGWPRLRGS